MYLERFEDHNKLAVYLGIACVDHQSGDTDYTQQDLFTHTVEQHLFSSLFRAFAESLASENAARLQAMSGAEDNIEDRLSELIAEYHSARQTTITEELLDLTVGYEALSTEEAF